jgi:putative copper resistance protein D
MIQTLLHSIVTFIDITALSTLAGVALCLLWTHRSNADEETSPRFVERLGRLLTLCLIALVISSISNFIQRTMEMSGLGITAILPVLPTVLFKTHYGRIGLVRAAGLGLALVVWFFGKRRLNSRFVAVFLLCASAAIAFSRSATSHAADFGDLSLQEISDWFHLLSAASWAGALIAVTAVFQPSLIAVDSLQQRILAGFADNFYVLFGPVLSVSVLTGLYNSWVEVGSFGVLLTTPYGRMLSAKLALFLILTLRYIAPPQHGQDESAFAVRFLRSTRVEAIMVLGILLCAAMLTHSIPARHFSHLEHMRADGDHAGHENGQHSNYAGAGPEPIVRIETTPTDIKVGTPIEMTVHIEDRNGRPLIGLTVHHEGILHAVIIGEDLNVFAHIHPEDMGPITDEMLKKAMFPLRYTFPKAGKYLIGLDFATANGLYSRKSYIKVSGQPKMGQPKTDFSTENNVGKYHVTLSLSPKLIEAGKETTLRYLIKKNERPVTDFEPYLSAPMHLAVVSADLKQFIHAHGAVPGETHTHMDHMDMHAVPEKFGPEIDAVIVFPVKGIYEIFSQVKHHGQVILFDFMVSVE